MLGTFRHEVLIRFLAKWDYEEEMSPVSQAVIHLAKAQPASRELIPEGVHILHMGRFQKMNKL